MTFLKGRHRDGRIDARCDVARGRRRRQPAPLAALALAALLFGWAAVRLFHYE